MSFGIKSKPTGIAPEEFRKLYDEFDASITTLDCGKRCAPYNEHGVPFCCDIEHAVPAVYDSEWDYLKSHTDLWHLWTCNDPELSPEEQVEEYERLKEETPEGMVLVECLGAPLCQRGYRSLTCRQFPFFPYIDSQGNILGLSYYWEYEDVCWVISNLDKVSPVYIQQMMKSFELVFKRLPNEFDNYQYHSEKMRDEFNKLGRAIPLLHRNGFPYKITTHNERMRRIPLESLPRFGDYKVPEELTFPDEV
ncbi:MAG: hypothetical protein JXA19_03970 [Anaerolineales bacterium]|nr:hypothetical protein [Anaerolineales bacterium]